MHQEDTKSISSNDSGQSAGDGGGGQNGNESIWDILRKEQPHHSLLISQYAIELCKSGLEQKKGSSSKLSHLSGQSHSDHHDPAKCIKAHSIAEKRRPPFNGNAFSYTAQMCPNIEQYGECTASPCPFAHNLNEVQYHPQIFKTNLCQFKEHCYRGTNCPNAHGVSDLRNGKKYLKFDVIPVKLQVQRPQNAASKQSSHSDLSQSAQNTQGPKPVKSIGVIQRAREKGVFVTIDLATFKTHQCPISGNHNPKKCPYYHENKKDRRRLIGPYQSDMCEFPAQNQICPKSDGCSKSHTRVEEFYHPEKFKIKFCSTYPKKIEQCEYGDYCSFAHREEELQIDLLHKMKRDEDFYLFHFKTVWCPYNENNHKRDECVYAHNWQDFRRKPQLYGYDKEQCPNWQTKNFIQVFSDGCQNQYNCKHSHGWKEQEYHPYNYKTNPCRQGEACKKPHCPYWHNDLDKRQPPGPGFKIIPRNRGVAFHTNYYLPYYISPSLIQQQPWMHGEWSYIPSSGAFVSTMTFSQQPSQIVVTDQLVQYQTAANAHKQMNKVQPPQQQQMSPYKQQVPAGYNQFSQSHYDLAGLQNQSQPSLRKESSHPMGLYGQSSGVGSQLMMNQMESAQQQNQSQNYYQNQNFRRITSGDQQSLNFAPQTQQQQNEQFEKQFPQGQYPPPGYQQPSGYQSFQTPQHYFQQQEKKTSYEKNLFQTSQNPYQPPGQQPQPVSQNPKPSFPRSGASMSYQDISQLQYSQKSFEGANQHSGSGKLNLNSGLFIPGGGGGFKKQNPSNTSLSSYGGGNQTGMTMASHSQKQSKDHNESFRGSGRGLPVFSSFKEEVSDEEQSNEEDDDIEIENFKNLIRQKNQNEKGKANPEQAMQSVMQTLKQMNLETIKEQIKIQQISFQDLLQMSQEQLGVFMGGQNKGKADELWKAIHMQENARNMVERMFNDLTINDDE